ncbi:MAG: hypothetical protein IAF38_20415 [Bacteroidia bacterium]|nr:hypothetical protein [Bacteroidia bacterium]
MNIKSIVFILTLCGVLSLLCCKTKKVSGGEKEEFFPVYSNATYVIPQRHPVHIDSAFVEGNILNLKVNYSGGCKKHFFQLNTDGVFAGTLPPLLPLFLDDTVKTDNCREFKEELIKFDVSKLKHPTQKEIVLKLADGQFITYSY